MESQSLRILAALKRGRGMTSLQALNDFGCLRLAARINDLRNMGYPIVSEIVTLKDGKRVAFYFMKSTRH